MSLHLRIAMIVLAVGVMVIIFRSVNKKHMRMQYSLVWIIISIALLLLAIFPVFAQWLCLLLGIETPSNLIFLLGILALLLLNFTQTGIISKQSEQIKTLTQALSLHQYAQEKEEIYGDKESGHEEG
ncbi:MAG: DUF2304 domain-containing protein [Clostridiales bacterium]|nr:DUF2304 domain-containing protein [Clostridiales bacterium]